MAKSKYFKEIQATDSDTVEWTGKDNNKVTVNIARIEGDKWKPALVSKSGRFFVTEEE